MPIVFEKSVFTNITNVIKNGIGTGLNLDAGEEKIGLPVSSVDGVAPTSNEYLYTLLKNLL